MNRKIKKQVLQLLAGDLDTARRELAQYDEHGLVNPLFSALYRSEAVLRWHTVTLFGEVLSRLADKDMEAARIVMRRFIWSLNDESGGIGWGAPEAMAEGIYHHDRLCEEYLHMLISYMRPDGPLAHQDGNYLELPALQRGLLWGVGRVAEKRTALLLQKNIVPDLLAYLTAEDAVVRAFAARALGLLGAVEAESALQALVADNHELQFYHEGNFTVPTVGEFAETALEQVRKQQAV
ncbi:MAG: HEAT repeat domain-containing protein [Desulfocapsa sp.]|nr:MAG: HEAT repeat domain-containing protein [Desulfocapsa sp.]